MGWVFFGIRSAVFRAGTWLNDSVFGAFSGLDQGRALSRFVNVRAFSGLGQGRALGVLSKYVFGLLERSGPFLS